MIFASQGSKSAYSSQLLKPWFKVRMLGIKLRTPDIRLRTPEPSDLALGRLRKVAAATAHAFAKLFALFRRHLRPAFHHAAPPVPAAISRSTEPSPSAEEKPA